MENSHKTLRYKGRFIKKHMLIKKLAKQNVGKANIPGEVEKSEYESAIKIKREEPEPSSYEFVTCENVPQVKIKQEEPESDNFEAAKVANDLDIDIKTEESTPATFEECQAVPQLQIKSEEPQPDTFNKKKSSIESILSGNRIVNLGFLADAMECAVCKDPLHLKDIEKETRRGLGSFLYVRCAICLSVTRVTTCEYLDSDDSKREHFEINSKVALGCVQADITNAKLNKLLTCLEIPALSYATQKYYEKKVRPTLEATTSSSCHETATVNNAEAENN